MSDPDLDLVQAGEPTEPDRQTLSLYDEETETLAKARLRAEIDDLDQDRDQRRTYGSRLYWLIVGWLSVIGVIVLLHGFICVPFKLSVTVLTTLIGSTTASVLGLFAIVANYLFPKR